MKASAFLDKLVVALLGGLLVCLGMLFYNLHELEKIEDQLERRAVIKSSKVGEKLEAMLLEMEGKSEERAGTGTVEGRTEESP